MRSLRANGYDFAYLETGEGIPLVLIHGSLLDCRYWRPHLAALGKFAHVVAPSRRSHWPADPKAVPKGYTTDTHAHDMGCFIEALDSGPVDLLGHSYGGYIALRMAISRPDLIRSLILVEPGGPIEGMAVSGYLKDPWVFARVAKLIAGGQTSLGVALFMDTVCGTPEWADCDEDYQSMTLDNAHTLSEQIKESRRPFAAEELASITCPTLLVGGARTPSPFPEVLDELEALISHSERITFNEASHLVNMECRDGFDRALIKFTSDLRERNRV